MSLPELTSHVEVVDNFLFDYFERYDSPTERGIQYLLESVRYSVQSGGKRFRPVLSLLVGDALGVPRERVLPFAAAVEMIHTYSLIHDDLPCMDNDDFRRERPTNHRVYGEDFALLAGDALLTEAFSLIAEKYALQPELATQLIRQLARAAGTKGMVGGQALDMKAKKNEPSFEVTKLMHEMKTGALIEVAAVGAALVAGVTEEKLQQARQFAQRLGLAFQVKDDLLDSTEENTEPGSFPALVGMAKTRELLDELTLKALDDIASWGDGAENLRRLVKFNQSRER